VRKAWHLGGVVVTTALRYVLLGHKSITKKFPQRATAINRLKGNALRWAGINILGFYGQISETAQR